MSYPDLHFLSFLVAYDMTMHHRKRIAPIESPPFGDGIPFVLLSYVKLVESVPSCHICDTKDEQPFLPFSIDHPLYKKWRHPFEEAEGDTIPVLVAIPRGRSGNFQIMTASAYISDFHDFETGTQDLMRSAGIRWLHCKLIDLPVAPTATS